MVPLHFSELPVSPEFFQNVHLNYFMMVGGQLLKAVFSGSCQGWCANTCKPGTFPQTLTATPVAMLCRLPALKMVPFYWCSNSVLEESAKQLDRRAKTLYHQTRGCLSPLNLLFSSFLWLKKKSFLLLLPVNSPISVQMKWSSFRNLLKLPTS